jgi:hypothetical protein
MRSPVKKIYITQKFGVTPYAYAMFGLQGHNGLDMRAFLHNGERCYEGGKSEVFAPHDGKVIENSMDTNGYGNYIKIENDKEGSVLAHFSAKSPKAVGATVKEGELVGYQGTTGNSSGIHLHWGYYTKPRDRSNGYNGFINQEGLYQPWGETMAVMYKGLDLTNQDSMKVAVDIWDEVTNKQLYIKKADIQERFGVPDLDGIATKLSGKDSRITDLTNQLGKAQAEVTNKTEIIKQKDATIANLNLDNQTLIERLEVAAENCVQLGKDKGNLAIEVEQLKIQVETLKAAQTEGSISLTLADLFRLIWNQKITITKG